MTGGKRKMPGYSVAVLWHLGREGGIRQACACIQHGRLVEVKNGA